MRIHILALNGVFDTGLAAVLDAFGTANALAEMTGISSLRFQMKVVGLRKSITTARGRRGAAQMVWSRRVDRDRLYWHLRASGVGSA
jgi:hypothetical protein